MVTPRCGFIVGLGTRCYDIPPDRRLYRCITSASPVTAGPVSTGPVSRRVRSHPDGVRMSTISHDPPLPEEPAPSAARPAGVELILVPSMRDLGGFQVRRALPHRQ